MNSLSKTNNLYCYRGFRVRLSAKTLEMTPNANLVRNYKCFVWRLTHIYIYIYIYIYLYIYIYIYIYIM